MPTVRSDARQLPLADESVDLIVTSPPYWSLRAYQDQGQYMEGQIGQETTPKMFVNQLRLATMEMVRVLKPTGSIFVNLGDKYAGSGGHNNMTLGPSAKSTLQNPHYGRKVSAMFRSPPQGGIVKSKVDDGNALLRNAPRRYLMTSDGVRPKSLMGIPWRYALMCVDDLNLILRAEIIWHKLNGIPESVEDRVTRRHEQIFHFTKEEQYYADIDDIRLPHLREANGSTFGGKKAVGAKDLTDSSSRRMGHNTYDVLNPKGKNPDSVWTHSSEPQDMPTLGVDHYAPYPPKLVRRIILGWSPVGGIVLDPFGGTGTTAGVAQTCNRIGLNLDLSSDYCRLAAHRLAHQFAQIGLPL